MQPSQSHGGPHAQPRSRLSDDCRGEALAVPRKAMHPTPIIGIQLRRAVLGTLLSAGRPLTANEIVGALHARGVTTGDWLTKGPSRVIGDLLAFGTIATFLVAVLLGFTLKARK